MKVSVILPTHNGGRLIARAINSVLTQSLEDFELIIIDDASSDNTPAIIEEFSRMDSRVRVYRQEAQGGLRHTLNHGLHLSQGEYIARIDDDDIWIDKEKTKNQVDFLDQEKLCSLVGSGCIFVNPEGQELGRYLPSQEDEQIRKILLGKSLFIHSSVMFRREPAVRLGGYGFRDYLAEDYCLWLKLGSEGKLANLPSLSVQYMFRQSSFSNKNIFRLNKECIHLIFHFRKYYNNFHVNFVRRMFVFFMYGILGVSPCNTNRIQLYKGIERFFPQILAPGAWSE